MPKLRAEEKFNPNKSENFLENAIYFDKWQEVKTTHININPRDVEDLGGRVFGGRESVEFVPAPVPLEGIERRRLKIIITPQNRLLTTLHYLRLHFQADPPQATRTFQENENRNEALSLVRIISPLLLVAREVAQHASARNCNSAEWQFPSSPIPDRRLSRCNCMRPQTHARASSHVHASAHTSTYTYAY